MMELDRARPFATITPPHEGAHFQQDGRSFDAAGRELAAVQPVERRKPGPKPKVQNDLPADLPAALPVMPVTAPVSDQVAAQLEV